MVAGSETVLMVEVVVVVAVVMDTVEVTLMTGYLSSA